MPPMEAAVEATREIGLAVLATTMSLVAIFVPVAFMNGIIGRFMASFGLTMAFAILVPLVVSFTLTPTMSARWLKLKRPTEDKDHHIHDSKHSRLFGPLDRGYARMLEWAMAHRGVIATMNRAEAIGRVCALHELRQLTRQSVTTRQPLRLGRAVGAEQRIVESEPGTSTRADADGCSSGLGTPIRDCRGSP